MIKSVIDCLFAERILYLSQLINIDLGSTFFFFFFGKSCFVVVLVVLSHSFVKYNCPDIKREKEYRRTC